MPGEAREGANAFRNEPGLNLALRLRYAPAPIDSSTSPRRFLPPPSRFPALPSQFRCHRGQFSGHASRFHSLPSRFSRQPNGFGANGEQPIRSAEPIFLPAESISHCSESIFTPPELIWRRPGVSNCSGPARLRHARVQLVSPTRPETGHTRCHWRSCPCRSPAPARPEIAPAHRRCASRHPKFTRR